MSKTSGVTIHFNKDGTTFARSFNGLNYESIGTKEMAEGKFVSKYVGIVDGEATTFDFTVTEKGIEVG